MELIFHILDGLFSYANTSVEKVMFPKVTLPQIIEYKVHVHDQNQRSIQTRVFATIADAMSWVNDMELMYSREKKVFLEYSKDSINSCIQLNILKDVH